MTKKVLFTSFLPLFCQRGSFQVLRMASTGVNVAAFQKDKAYVDGKWVSAKSGKTFEGD